MTIPPRRAAIILATAHRRRILDTCLGRLVRQDVPGGWTYRIYVAGTYEDFGVEVLRQKDAALAQAHVQGVLLACDGLRWCRAPTEAIGHKLRVAFQRADADGTELILWVGDDDLQPPTRLRAAIDLHVEGWRGSGVPGFWYVDLSTGQIAWWQGDRRWYGAGLALPIAAWRRIGCNAEVGGQRVDGYASVIGRIDGEVTLRRDARPEAWDIDRAAEPWLYHETWMDPAICGAAPIEVARGVVCLHHGRNMTSHPWPARGETIAVGLYAVAGAGALDDPPEGFPCADEIRWLAALVGGARPL